MCSPVPAVEFFIYIIGYFGIALLAQTDCYLSVLTAVLIKGKSIFKYFNIATDLNRFGILVAHILILVSAIKIFSFMGSAEPDVVVNATQSSCCYLKNHIT